MSAARPLISVYASSGTKTSEAPLPSVFLSALRPDIVQFCHTNMNKNHRQAYAVSMKAGHMTSAHSWGTGRAVARIPRVGGGGTQRSGQGAFGNMCRGGRMFAPTRTYRKWHRRVNTTQKRYAVASALAATAVPALVMARGHRVENVVEMPLVVQGDCGDVTKSKQAREMLSNLGAMDDVEKAVDSKKLRKGKGKMRNRRYVTRKGPLIVYSGDKSDVERGFRNFPGVDVCNVDRLNLLQLAPGGHMGRFVIYTESAFAALDGIYGPDGKNVPEAVMKNADLGRIINSDEVQSVLNPAKSRNKKYLRKKNAVKSMKALEILSPYAAAARKSEARAMENQKKARAAKVTNNRKDRRERGDNARRQGDVCEDGFGV